MEKSQHIDQTKGRPMSLLKKALLTGFVGGLFWSSIGSLVYYFHFSEVSHASFTIRSFWNASWTNGIMGEMLSIVFIGIISIGISYVYYALLKKRPGMVPGIVFGLLLWFIVFYLLKPMFSAVPALTEMETTTVITTICLYILYGTFIGYSISYEYDHLQQAEASKKKSSQKTG